MYRRGPRLTRGGTAGGGDPRHRQIDEALLITREDLRHHPSGAESAQGIGEGVGEKGVCTAAVIDAVQPPGDGGIVAEPHPLTIGADTSIGREGDP